MIVVAVLLRLTQLLVTTGTVVKNYGAFAQNANGTLIAAGDGVDGTGLLLANVTSGLTLNSVSDVPCISCSIFLSYFF